MAVPRAKRNGHLRGGAARSAVSVSARGGACMLVTNVHPGPGPNAIAEVPLRRHYAAAIRVSATRVSRLRAVASRADRFDRGRILEIASLARLPSRAGDGRGVVYRLAALRHAQRVAVTISVD